MWWFLYGLVLGAGAMGMLVHQGKIVVNWYVWVMALLALALGTLTVQHFFASLKEMEPRAAWMGLLFLGLPALILGGVVSLFLLTSG